MKYTDRSNEEEKEIEISDQEAKRLIENLLFIAGNGSHWVSTVIDDKRVFIVQAEYFQTDPSSAFAFERLEMRAFGLQEKINKVKELLK